MSELHLERDDLHAATQHLVRSQELSRFRVPHNRYRWPVAMAGVCRAQGDLRRARPAQRGQSACISAAFPPMYVRSRRSRRVWVALGRLDEALGWARESDLSVEDDLSYLREFEHITLVKVLLAQHTTERRRAPPGGDSTSGAPPASGRGRSEDEVFWRSWCCRRLPTRRRATSLLRWPHCNARADAH